MLLIAAVIVALPPTLVGIAVGLAASVSADVGENRLPARLPKRVPPVTLSNGESFASGKIDTEVRWQSSGVILPFCLNGNVIKKCWTLQENAKGQRAETRGTARQRIEFLSWPPAKTGSKWHYSWKYHLSEGIGSSNHFFHLTQLFSRSARGFILALDLLDGRIQIVDSDSSRCGRDSGKACPSLSVEDYWGRTTLHDLRVEYGEEGSVDYTILDLSHPSHPTLLHYSFSDSSVPGRGSLKTGLYRAVVDGATTAEALVGDFDFRKLQSREIRARRCTQEKACQQDGTLYTRRNAPPPQSHPLTCIRISPTPSSGPFAPSPLLAFVGSSSPSRTSRPSTSPAVPSPARNSAHASTMRSIATAGSTRAPEREADSGRIDGRSENEV
ncbi:hypothetical protein JCM21900_000393 [Sporobolomyces salmonicolor]